MHCHVDDAGLDANVLDFPNESRDSARDLYAPLRNRREHNAFEVRVSLDDLVRNPA